MPAVPVPGYAAITSLLSATVPGFGVGLQVLCAWYGDMTSIARLGMRVTGAAAAGRTEMVSAPSSPSRTAIAGRAGRKRRDTGRDPQRRGQGGHNGARPRESGARAPSIDPRLHRSEYPEGWSGPMASRISGQGGTSGRHVHPPALPELECHRRLGGAPLPRAVPVPSPAGFTSAYGDALNPVA